MKKRVMLVLIISILLVSVISVSLVSAGLLGDAWSKITGRVTEENVTDDESNGNGDSVEPEPPVEEPPAEEEICGDDICQGGEVCDIDCCEDFCALECPNGAVQGSCGCECIETEPEPPQEDKECEEGEMRYYGCPDGTKVPNCECKSGMWVCKIFKDENCPDDGPEPRTCAAKIQITFNKDSYKIGDDVKIIIETFDSQGNHLPNYAFYGQMYDDRWHTPDLQKTDNKGYLIHTGIAEKPAGGVTEVTFKVYTKEIGACGSVEDTGTVKFEQGECGMGGCESEPGCKDKVRMCGGSCEPCPEDDGEIFYACSGCELEGKCYPYGYRKAGSFCSDAEDVFVEQLADDEKCENNFECKTNLCIDGNCMSSNVWNKFLRWFKKLFGGGDEEEPKDCSKILIEKDIGDYEYNQSLYGISKETQAPLISDDCEQIGMIKCCVAQYLENGNSGMGLMCPYDNRGEVENLVRCGLIGVGNVIGEYKGEKVIKMDEGGGEMMIWTHKSYALAVGRMPESGIPEEVADGYLQKYKSDLGEIDIGDVPPPPGPKSCEEYDGEERDECYVKLAIKNRDVEICENIVYDSNHRNKCYINVAEHTGDSSICEKVTDSSLKEKCYFWVAGETGEEDSCAGIADVDLQTRCYGEVAEKTGDASFCDKIIDSHIGDKCYRDVGIQTNNKALCNKIIEEQAKQKCLDNTS